jgi:hypothetical protein
MTQTTWAWALATCLQQLRSEELRPAQASSVVVQNGSFARLQALQAIQAVPRNRDALRCADSVVRRTDCGLRRWHRSNKLGPSGDNRTTGARRIAGLLKRPLKRPRLHPWLHDAWVPGQRAHTPRARPASRKHAMHSASEPESGLRAGARVRSFKAQAGSNTCPRNGPCVTFELRPRRGNSIQPLHPVCAAIQHRLVRCTQ